MASERLQIIIDATFKGKGDIEAAGRQLKDLDDKARKASEGTRYLKEQAGKHLAAMGLAFGAVSAAGYATWKMLEQGAELELAASRFDRLTESIGTTSDALMTDLKAATGGMVSNADMIASASQIISLGLADTQEGVVDLASLVSQLGWDMQQVIMTFANNSKMRLDALGLSVTDVEERAKRLEAQGYDTDKAFDLAVIQAGQAKLELLGSAADTTAGKIKKFEAGIANLKDNAALLVAEGLTPSVDAMNTLMDVYAEGPSIIGGIVDAQIAEAETVQELIDLYGKLEAKRGIGSLITNTTDDLAAGMVDVRDAIFDASTSADEYAKAIAALGIPGIEANRITEEMTQALYDAALAEYEATNRERERLDVLQRVNEWAAANTKANALMGEQYSITANRTEDLSMTIAQMNYHQEEAYEGMISSTAVLEANAKSLEDHAASVAIVRGEYETAVGVMQSFSTTISEGYGAAALAAEDSQARQITANDAISESYKTTALNVFSAKLAETIQEDGLGAANAMIAYQQALGLITPEEAAKLEEVALKTEAITDATGALFDAYMSDGVLTREEMDLMAEAVRSIDEGTSLMSDTIIRTAAEDIPKLVGLHQETATFDEKLGNASSSAGILKDNLDALPTRLDIDVYINTHGNVPDVGGTSAGGNAPSGGPGGNGPGPGGSYASGTGGWVTVPPGYPNDTYNARLTSGERFNVIPAGQSGGMGGGGATISISFAGAIFQGTTQQQAAQIAQMTADKLGRLV